MASPDHSRPAPRAPRHRRPGIRHLGKAAGLRRYLRAGRAGEAWGALAALAYLTLLSGYLITHGSWPTPDILMPPLLVIALLLGRPFAFFVDWAPFLGLWLLWQWLADAAAPDDLTRVHITGPLEAEQRLFGVVPTVALQTAFFRPERLAWYDWAAAFIHGAHFAMPVAMAFMLWVRRRRDFWRLAAAILTMSFIGLFIYWRYPAAPPWMAAEQGEMEHAQVWRIVGATLGRFPVTEPLGYAYQRFEGNAVAAVPSLHAAMPLLLTLVLWRLRPRWAPLAMLYTLTMAVAVVYLGEHYVVDVLAGWGVAVAAFALVWLIEVVAVSLRAVVGRLRGTHPPRADPVPQPLPRWWQMVYPALPLLALLLVMAGPLGYRPSRRLIAPPPPPPCLEVFSEELSAIAAGTRELAESAVLFVADLDGPACSLADPHGLFAEPFGRPVRFAALYRLATDVATLWDPLVPAGALTFRRLVTAPTPDGGMDDGRTYAVLLLLVNPSDPLLSEEAILPVLEAAAAAARAALGE